MSKYELKNIMMESMEELMPGIIKDTGMCTCEKCRMDMMCLALNKLPPHYAVSQVGNAMQRYTLYTPQKKTDIVAALYEAARIVKENPQHDI